MLDASGVVAECEGGVRGLISLVRAKEMAQAALATAAAARVAQSPCEPEGGVTAALFMPEEGDQATRVALPPSPCRGKVRRVAKAATSRGVRLRNRII